jgi:hypothetical protein
MSGNLLGKFPFGQIKTPPVTEVADGAFEMIFSGDFSFFRFSLFVSPQQPTHRWLNRSIKRLLFSFVGT